MKRIWSAAVVAAIVVGPAACESPPPAAALDASPLEGQAPLEVVLDASASAGAGALSFRFDVDGDGAWDTEPSSEPRLTHVYPVAGTFAPRVEVTDEQGHLAVAEAPAPVEVRASPADLGVDVNRDGRIDGDDEVDADVWTDARGAVFFANFDDDDGDQRRDFRDDEVDGAADVADFAPVVIRRSAGLGEAHTATLFVEPKAAADRVRLFRESQEGGAAEGALELVHGLGTGSVSLDPGSLSEGDVRLYLEGAGSRDQEWDGRVTLRLEVKRGDAVLAEDEVVMRAAPILFPDNTRPAEVLYVMRIADQRYGENLAFYDALAANVPDGVELYTVDPQEYGGDRWVQDNMQTGYQLIPAEGGERHMLTYLETERMSGYGLEYLVPYELLTSGFGFAYPGGEATSLNYGGNLEIAPPHTAGGREHPFGRVLIGGGDGGMLTGRSYEDHMAAEQRAFLDAQELQGAALELSTEWLAVGHLDEIFLFVPDATRPERPWRVVFASPTLARSALVDLEQAGQGGLPVFEGRETETTVSAILSDADLMAFNDAAQARIDSVRDVLTEAMALTDEDILELPVLYEVVPYGGMEFAAAYNPGVQNLVVTNRTLFVPDPEGPEPGGEDVWQALIRDALEPLGNEVLFVDVFDSYHLLLGEAHCGTNVRHTPYEARWWEL